MCCNAMKLEEYTYMTFPISVKLRKGPKEGYSSDLQGLE